MKFEELELEPPKGSKKECRSCEPLALVPRRAGHIFVVDDEDRGTTTKMMITEDGRLVPIEEDMWR